MESSVFSYFFAIGSGFTLGVAVIVLPGIWATKRLIKKPGGKKHAV
ncbi:hypothetical protein [Paenibacillus oralis]|nr:hypothetical protein [Paenibacillus oralis]